MQTTFTSCRYLHSVAIYRIKSLFMTCKDVEYSKTVRENNIIMITTLGDTTGTLFRKISIHISRCFFLLIALAAYVKFHVFDLKKSVNSLEF